MPDVVSREKRSQMMSGIKGQNTKPEMLIRRGLHRLGFRYRLHDRTLPGKPDLVFPRYRAVIFVNGCFWHAHDCHLFKWPSSGEEFWREKITSNQKRDRNSHEALTGAGWRTLDVWECALRGKKRLPVDEVIQMIAEWLKSDLACMSISEAEGLSE